MSGLTIHQPGEHPLDSFSEPGPVPAPQPVAPVGPVRVGPVALPAEPRDPLVLPHPFKYTIQKTSGSYVNVTSFAPTPADLHRVLFRENEAVPDAVPLSKDGRYAFFPEAVVRVDTVDDVIAGWSDAEDPDEEDELDEEEEEERLAAEEHRLKRLKRLKKNVGGAR